MMLKRVSSFILLLVLSVAVEAWAQRTTLTHSAYSVTTASSLALAANKGRNFLIVENISDTDLYCAFGTAAVVNQGLRLGASGGAILLDVKFPTTALYCIHGSTGTKTLLITEGVQ